MSQLSSSASQNSSYNPITTKRSQVKDSITTDIDKAKTFALWYKHMIDNNRQNLGMYLSDDAILEWFGRTVKTRKKVSLFIKHEMQCSRHNFVSIQNIDEIQNRLESGQRKQEMNSSSFRKHSPEMIGFKKERKCRKRVLISDDGSPEWADGCGLQKDIHTIEAKKMKSNDRQCRKRVLISDGGSPEWADGCGPQKDIHIIETKKVKSNDFELIGHQNDDCLQTGYSDCNSKGDGALERKVKRKLVLATPPNRELGQGDCLPSTSSAASDMSHEALNAQLPKVYVECNGFIKFIRTRNGHSMDAMNWERKCKIQISYSEDPLNVGEYIIWAIHYSDESKCRRNLLAAFEEVAIEEADDSHK